VRSVVALPKVRCQRRRTQATPLGCLGTLACKRISRRSTYEEIAPRTLRARNLDPTRVISPGRHLLFVSKRVFLLRAITLLLLAQVVLVCWLVSLAPQVEWRAVLGETFWWALPAGLVGLSLILPLSLFWLHDRYALRLEVTPNAICITTFLVWGQRMRTLDRKTFPEGFASEIPGTRGGIGQFAAGSARRVRLPAHRLDLLFDREGEFPEGEESVVELFQKI
jgi:hypothetical protein